MPYTTTKSDFYNALYNESKTAQGGKYWSDVFKQNQQLYDQAQTAAKEGIEQVKQNLYNTENAYIAQQQALYRQGEQAKYDYSQDYNEALAKAYQSSLNQRAGLLGSNVISGYKEQNLSAMDIALDEAYKSYTRQFNQNIGNVEQTVGKGVTDTLTNINKARQSAQSDIEDITTNLETVRNYINKQNEALSDELMSEAENMEKTFNAIGDYYTYLYNQYFDKGVSKVDERDNPFLNNPEMRMMYLDEGVDEAGQPYYRLKSVDEMSSTFYDKDNEGKLTLNERGRKFYDQFLNYNPTDLFMRDDQGNLTTQKRTDFNVNDFSTWLKGKNEDLYSWLTSYDEYNSNVTGQKAGTFREMLGLKADDYTYSYLEHAAAMDRTAVDKMFKNFDTYNENINKAIKDFTADIDKLDPTKDFGTIGSKYNKFKDDIASQMTSTLNEYKKVLSSLGVTEFDNLIDSFTSAIKSGDSKDLGEVQKLYDEASRQLSIQHATGTGVGAVGGAALGAGIGSAILPGLGTIIGALVGAAAVGTTTSLTAKEMNKDETNRYATELKAGYKKYAAQLQTGYNELVAGLINDLASKGKDSDKTAE